jgi:hypothetical protein
MALSSADITPTCACLTGVFAGRSWKQKYHVGIGPDEVAEDQQGGRGPTTPLRRRANIDAERNERGRAAREWHRPEKPEFVAPGAAQFPRSVQCRAAYGGPKSKRSFREQGESDADAFCAECRNRMALTDAVAIRRRAARPSAVVAGAAEKESPRAEAHTKRCCVSRNELAKPEAAARRPPCESRRGVAAAAASAIQFPLL